MASLTADLFISHALTMAESSPKVEIEIVQTPYGITAAMRDFPFGAFGVKHGIERSDIPEIVAMGFRVFYVTEYSAEVAKRATMTLARGGKGTGDALAKRIIRHTRHGAAINVIGAMSDLLETFIELRVALGTRANPLPIGVCVCEGAEMHFYYKDVRIALMPDYGGSLTAAAWAPNAEDQ